MDVTVGHSLNEVEEQHITSRRVTVQQCLKENNITTRTLDEVPNIALIASGGGQRAMVGLLGSLLQLGREGLLDCMLYLSTVSGSTWCMASLYKHSNWSSRQEAVTGAIVERLGRPSCVTLEEMLAKLNKYFSQSDNYSLTHLWSALVVPKYVKEMDEQVLSAQRGQHNMDPYPIYTIIDKNIKQEQRQLQDLWFELSPGAAGYSIAGFFVDQAHFGSQFDNGSLMKTQPEMDMLYVQGMCSSCYADEVETWKDIKEWLMSLWHSSTYEECSCQKCEALQALVELNIRASLGEEDLSGVAQKMNKLLEGQVDRKANAVFLDPNNMLTLEKTVWRDKLKEYTLDVSDGFSSWINSYENCNIPASWWAVITSTIACAAQWKWGTQYNFLYNRTADEVEPSILAAETRDYMDAGLVLNSPYFSVLRPERNVDLIISLDFSEDPMESVKGAVEMSKEMGIAFPHVVIPKDASSRPEDFYVFPGDSKSPTVIHMPLFNIINCGDDLEEWKQKYTTNQGAYSPELITGLMEKAAVNVKNTKAKLLEQIERAVHEKVHKHKRQIKCNLL